MSQSLRKSGQFLSERGEGYRRVENRRNPFVNQVSFFRLICDGKPVAGNDVAIPS